MGSNRRPRLAFERARAARYSFDGPIGARLLANLRNWLLTAPQANPAMLEMFRDRDKAPRRDLVPWAGEFAGKYLMSAVLGWRLSHDARLRAQLDRFADDLISVQDTDGYMGPFPRDQRLTGKTIGGKSALWDLWGHYHCMLGLLLWYEETGHPPALKACRRAADHVCNRFLDTGERVIDAGAEEMNMAISHVLCLLYLETGEPSYLRMVREIETDWQTPPSGDYVRTALRGLPFHETPKPRWESLHDVQAILSLYEITGEEDYRRAFEHIWRSIKEGDIHNTGGFSSGERAKGNPYDQGAIETCCTVSWMALSADMLRLTGDSLVADALEVSTFNAALGAQSPSGRWWTYDTPMDGVRKASAHHIVFQAREGSPELNCCSVNGPRSLGLLSEWAVMRAHDGPVINYYGPCTIGLDSPSGQRLQITQLTEYPLAGTVRIRVALEHPEHFCLRLRVPAWSIRTRIRVNEEDVGDVRPGSYLKVAREWRDGDTIEIELDLSLRTWVGQREAAGTVSLYHGPVLLAYDLRHNSSPPDHIPQLNLERIEVDKVLWEGAHPKPWLLLRLPAADGTALNLCDFATAGAGGTPYASWLPYAT